MEQLQKESHSDGLEALLEDGEAEPRLEDFLSGLEDFSDGFVVLLYRISAVRCVR